MKRALSKKSQKDLEASVVAAREFELDVWENDPYVQKLRCVLYTLCWYVLLFSTLVNWNKTTARKCYFGYMISTCAFIHINMLWLLQLFYFVTVSSTHKSIHTSPTHDSTYTTLRVAALFFLFIPTGFCAAYAWTFTDENTKTW